MHSGTLIMDAKKPPDKNDFFHKDKCDRCGAPLGAFTMSWFTEETICLDCSAKEDEIKKKLREAGKDPADYEGCGYVPEV